MFKNILVLCDNRIGTTNQSLGLAYKLKEKTGADITKIYLEYNNLIKLPDCSWFLKGLYPIKNKSDFDNIKPDLIIAAGRRASLIAKILKKALNIKTIIIMWPGETIAKSADIILLPIHDRLRNHPNVIRVLGALHNITEERTEEASKEFINFQNIPMKRIACLIGGSHNSGKFTIEAAKKLANKLLEISKKENAYLLITTSRRTGSEQTNILKSILKDKLYFYDGDGNNPYLAYLHYADEIIVTSDSISMISEVISVGKPVYIFDNEDLSGKKHKMFLKALIKEGYIKTLEDYTPFKPKKINIMDEVAEKVISKL
ncbi:MAG: mitochondrial fission ELM1 family protein [Sphingobacteriia bacterium]|nr:mitochondrial fission ELM1 family protein [Sphingobacteriia bacterium]